MSYFFDDKKVRELVGYGNDLHRKFSFPTMGPCGYTVGCVRLPRSLREAARFGKTTVLDMGCSGNGLNSRNQALSVKQSSF
jgi:hypothetical protein